jgi:hypothetical protein
MPISTDLPSRAIETRRKMSAPLGNVPFAATVSQAPFVEIRTLVRAVSGAAESTEK